MSDEELRSEVADLAIRLGMLEQEIEMLKSHLQHSSEQFNIVLQQMKATADVVEAMKREVEWQTGHSMPTNCPKCTRKVGRGQRHCGICGHKW